MSPWFTGDVSTYTVELRPRGAIPTTMKLGPRLHDGKSLRQNSAKVRSSHEASITSDMGMNMRQSIIFFAVLAVACSGADQAETNVLSDTAIAETVEAAAPAGTGATAVVRDAAGNELGTVTLTDSPQGIALSGTLRGLPPSEHGIHIHTVGACEAPFESAGPHWNPTTRQHGTENPMGPHFGDLPNLVVGADSTATVQGVTPGGTLRGENALLDADGASVVVHAGKDDYKTDPSGNSGARIACGVIQ